MGSAKPYCAVVRYKPKANQYADYLWVVEFYDQHNMLIDFRRSNSTNHIKDRLKSRGFRTRVEWSRIQGGHSVELYPTVK